MIMHCKHPPVMLPFSTEAAALQYTHESWIMDMGVIYPGLSLFLWFGVGGWSCSNFLASTINWVRGSKGLDDGPALGPKQRLTKGRS